MAYFIGRTAIASLLVLASCCDGCVTDCKVAGNEMCADDWWLIVSHGNADEGYIIDF